MKPARTAALAAVALSALLLGLRLPAKHRPEDAPRPVNPYFGINAHIPSVDDFDAIARGGFGIVRVDFTWNVMEPRPGEYRWDISDGVVQDAEAHGVEVLGILGYCPKWASSGPDEFYPPRDVLEWQGFVNAMVSRYRGRVRFWSLWNEPNSNTFFHGSVEQFVRQVLLPGAQAAKAADPACRIVGPELAHLEGAHWDTWLDRILAEAGPQIDVISHHCYKPKPAELFRMLEGPSRPWEPQPVQRIIERRGQGGKPFWLTEFGWRSTSVGQDRQTGYLISTLRGAPKRHWISRMFIYELRDSPKEPGFGLMSYAGQPKPSYTAVRGFIHGAPVPRPSR
jgi:polysaccharide biosynthesis protein PslG